MTHDTDHDFQQFRGKFDSAMVPDAAFKAKMEKLLNAEHQHVAAERVSSLIASPSTAGSATVVPTRRNHPLMVAAAVLMVFAVVASSIWVLSGIMLEGEYASAPGGIATLPADASGTPGPDIELTASLLQGIDKNGYLIGIFNNVLITQSSRGEADTWSTIIRGYDAESGDLLWESEEYMDFYTAEGGVLIRQRYTVSKDGSLQASDTTTLIALDLRTGESLWSTELDFQNLWVSSPNTMIIDDSVIAVSNAGEIVALSLTSGQIQWQSSVDPGKGRTEQISAGDNDLREVTIYSLAAVAWNNQLAVINGNGTVYLIDIVTGDTTGSYDKALFTDNQVPFAYIDAIALSHGILVSHDHMSSDGIHTMLVAFDPETGETLWERNLEGSGSIDVSDDGSIAVNTHIWKQSNWLMQLIGNHGYSTFQLHWIDGNTGNEILTTERGKLETSPFTMTNGSYVCTRTKETEISCYDRNGTRYFITTTTSGTPVLADGMLFVPTDDGIATVQLP